MIIGSITIKRIIWPSWTVPVLGMLMLVLYITYTIVTIQQTPPSAQYLTTHAGIFSIDASRSAALFLALTLVYALAFWYVRTTGVSKRKLRQIIIWALLFGAVLLVSTPFMSVDLYGYVYRAQIVNLHHVNPYQVAPADLGYQTLVPYADGVMPYGPLYTTYTIALQKIIGNNFAANVALFRIANVLLLSICAWLLYRIARRLTPRSATIGVALFVWNPFILIEIINNGHNDVLVMLTILASLLLLFRKQPVWAGLVLAAGFLIKFITILLLPLVLLWIVYQPWSSRAKIVRIGAVMLAVLAVIGLLYLPYQNFSDNVGNLGRAYMSSYKITFPVALIRWIFGGIATVIAGAQQAGTLLQYMGVALFALWYACVALYHRGSMYARSLPGRYILIVLGALSLIPIIFNIWYLLWIMPLLLFLPGKYQPLLIIFTVSGFVFYFDGILLANTLLFILGGLYLAYVHGTPRVVRFLTRHNEPKKS